MISLLFDTRLLGSVQRFCTEWRKAKTHRGVPEGPGHGANECEMGFRAISSDPYFKILSPMPDGSVMVFFVLGDFPFSVSIYLYEWMCA